jgi:hypothetical protein
MLEVMLEVMVEVMLEVLGLAALCSLGLAVAVGLSLPLPACAIGTFSCWPAPWC